MKQNVERSGLKVAVVGGLTIDRIFLPDGESKKSMGGGGYYCSVVARKFGNEVVLKTVIGKDFPRDWIAQLEEIGVKVIPELADRSIEFVNEYSAQGSRRQRVLSRPSRGISALDKEITESEIVQLTPVFGELDESIVPQLSKTSTSLEAQGFIRITENTKVRKKFWHGRDTWLPSVRFISFSMDELHYVVKRTVFELLEDYGIEAVSLTNGSAEAFVFSNEKTYLVPAYPVKEVDPTGCGDAFSMVLSLLKAQGKDLQYAALMAASTSSFIAERGGLENFPSIEEVESRAERLRAAVRCAQLSR